VTQPVLLDTGPLVAALDRRDRYHAWAKKQFHLQRAPLLTCEAVVTEACHLVRNLPKGKQNVVRLFRSGAVAVAFRFTDHVEALTNLLERYANVPISFADACLVCMAELHDPRAILTIDGDFKVYRKNVRQIIPTIMPEDR